MITEVIGWVSAAILLATISRQVYKQWHDKTAAGVSKWLFVGQVAASSGFTVYSWLLENWVFMVTNALILTSAIVGEAVYRLNKRLHPD